jgi:hypothetical protein
MLSPEQFEAIQLAVLRRESDQGAPAGSVEVAAPDLPRRPGLMHAHRSGGLCDYHRARGDQVTIGDCFGSVPLNGAWCRVFFNPSCCYQQGGCPNLSAPYGLVEGILT